MLDQARREQEKFRVKTVQIDSPMQQAPSMPVLSAPVQTPVQPAHVPDTDTANVTPTVNDNVNDINVNQRKRATDGLHSITKK